jgi:hypothetical protein
MNHEQAVTIAERTPNAVGPARFDGTWENQMGSVMSLQVNGTDVTGTYTSASSGQGHGGPITGPLKGYAKGDLISFLVLWPTGSQTAWTGQMTDEEGPDRIETLWHLVTDTAEDDEDLYFWKSTYAGADVFTRPRVAGA